MARNQVSGIVGLVNKCQCFCFARANDVAGSGLNTNDKGPIVENGAFMLNGYHQAGQDIRNRAVDFAVRRHNESGLHYYE